MYTNQKVCHTLGIFVYERQELSFPSSSPSCQVASSGWSNLLGAVSGSGSVEELVGGHRGYLTAMHRDCFLSSNKQVRKEEHAGGKGVCGMWYVFKYVSIEVCWCGGMLV